ncbi:hypothetical protein D8674_037056 [Pyrus ussuriensis x Pyrus communis]|uniref:Uncharacterized protein n=1 Tax=Pyrus ussuriensis x Pyrus communis TaxID=2448454 RepID=A0A5N5GWU8_9ROSA|nr:hypothetical protein D8674_037056 [Pyrus ussuriensis x Pyrus communis]
MVGWGGVAWGRVTSLSSTPTWWSLTAAKVLDFGASWGFNELLNSGIAEARGFVVAAVCCRR